MNTCGSSGWPPVMGLGGMPNTGSALITPITGFAVAAARAIARVRSYSSSGSRSGASAGKASFWSA